MKKIDDNWTYIRIRISTAKKLKLLKTMREDDMYDSTLDYLLSKENLEFKSNSQKKEVKKNEI